MKRLSAAIRLCWLAAVISQIYAEVSRSKSHFHLILACFWRRCNVFGQIHFQILDVISCDVVIIFGLTAIMEKFSLNKESFLSVLHIVGCYLLFVYTKISIWPYSFHYFSMGIYVNYKNFLEFLDLITTYPRKLNHLLSINS